MYFETKDSSLLECRYPGLCSAPAEASDVTVKDAFFAPLESVVDKWHR